MTNGVQWQVTINGAENTLALWAHRLQNAEPAFDEMADALAVIQKDWFRSEGEGTWPQLKEPYRSWKRKRFPKRGILHGPDRKGHRGLQLRDQLTKRPFGYERVTRAELIIGSTLPYSKYHQLGMGNLPVRQPLKPLDARTIEILKKIIQNHIVEQTIRGR